MAENQEWAHDHPPVLPTRICTAFKFWARCTWKCISTSYLLHGSDCPVLNLPAKASPTWPILPHIAGNWLRSCRLWMRSSCYQLVPNENQASSHMFLPSPAFLWIISLHLSASSILHKEHHHYPLCFQHHAPKGAPSIPNSQSAIPRETLAIWVIFGATETSPAPESKGPDVLRNLSSLMPC